ncbi:hypothetical protein SB912_34280, partial [Pantoea sp. SIMBA_072]
GYSGALKNLSYSVAVAHARDSGPFGRSDTQFTASISIPLGGGARSHRMFANTVASTNGDVSTQVGVNGFLNEANTVNY